MLPVAVAIFAASIISAPLLARQQPAVTADDYARAERFLAPAVTPLVSGGSVAATWLPDDRFWYRNALPTGAEFILVDPVKKTRTRAFDHAKLAAALSTAAGAKVDELGLPFQAMDLSPDGATLSFNLAAKRWTCDAQGSKCATTGDAVMPATPPAAGRGGRGRGAAGGPTSSDGKPLTISPDARRGVFIRDWNLWVMDLATRQERQLTTDGVKYFGYATRQ